MKALKFLSLLLIGSLPFVTMQCCKCDEEPPPLDHPDYRVQPLILKNIDNSNTVPVFSDSGAVFKEAYGIGIVLLADTARKPTLTLSHPLKRTDEKDCCVPPFTPWRLSSLNIFTIADFDSDHAAGADITRHFRYQLDGYHFNQVEGSGHVTFENIFDSRGNFVLPVFLMQPPSTKGRYQFRVEFRFERDTTLYSALTTPVFLK